MVQIWHSCGVQLCVCPQFMWFSVGSALVQVCVAIWFTGSGEVLRWLSFVSVGRAIHGVWFSIGGVVWCSYELPFYHMWCMCGSYCCGVILLCDLVQLCVSRVAFVSGVSVDGSDLIKLWVQTRFSARCGLSVYVVQLWFSFG